MSLQKFHIFFVLFTLAGILLLSFSINHLLQKNIDIHVENSIRNDSIEISERMRNNYAIIEQKFTRYKQVSLGKLQESADYVAAHPNDIDLSSFAGTINANVVDGSYAIYVINGKKVIEKSSSGADIGFDFTKYPFYAQLLERLKAGSEVYGVSAPSIDNHAMSLKQYYFMRGEGDYWVEIVYALPIADYVKSNFSSFYKIYPSLTRLAIYIITPDYMQQINKEEREESKSTPMIANDSAIASMIMNDLHLQEDPSSSDYQTITSTFRKQNTVFLPEAKKLQTVYALVRDDTGKVAGDFQLVAKMEFDADYHHNEYLQLKNLLYLFTVFVFVFTVLSFILMYRAVILKITNITRQMQKDEPIVPQGHLFSEFHFLIQRYNNFLLRWKEEVCRLNEMIMLDELTQCFNRRYFNLKLQKQIDLFKRYGQGFSMIMFDIDDFKNINDTYGHDTGDYILRSIVGEVKKQIRASDVICRIGGEEFAVILPETTLEHACIVAEKIRSAVAMQEYIGNERVTVSLGVEAFNEGYAFSNFYKAVDTLLYKSKRNGKNCVNGNCKGLTHKTP
jgi:diguanylate cyclase (GGDEF)-like protein